MKILVTILLGMLLVSCVGVAPQTAPVRETPPVGVRSVNQSAPSTSKGRAVPPQVETPAPSPSISTARRGGPAPGGKEKLLSGKVTFRGLSPEQLFAFRVIPENSTEIFIPDNRRYVGVDGLWWRGDRTKWYKIPDHGEAWVVGENGVAPSVFKGQTRRDGFSIYWNSLPGLGMANILRGGVSDPGWYPNSGNSRIGVSYPFE